MAHGNLKVLDSDIHIIEPPDLWQRYIDPAFRDRAPHRAHRGRRATCAWPRTASRGGASPRTPIAAGAVTGVTTPRTRSAGGRSRSGAGPRRSRSRRWTSRASTSRWSIPRAGLFALAIPDMEPRLAAAMARAYNDWLYEFCQENPERLLGAGMISPFDVDDAVAETRRCVRELGFRSDVPAAERGERPELARSVLRAAVDRARGARGPAGIPRGRRARSCGRSASSSAPTRC